jgi:hypothetical protein
MIVNSLSQSHAMPGVVRKSLKSGDSSQTALPYGRTIAGGSAYGRGIRRGQAPVWAERGASGGGVAAVFETQVSLALEVRERIRDELSALLFLHA